MFNEGYGIFIDVTASNIKISNNFIGTNIKGESFMGNQKGGICMSASNSLITENVISGNGGAGISCAFLYTHSNNGMNIGLGGTISKNKIGTDFTGKIAIPNTGSGIEVDNVQNLIIGGNLPSDGNIISGNKGHGIYCEVGYGYVLNIPKGSIKGYLYNNRIGTDSSGLSPLPNDGYGIATDSYNYGIYYIGSPNKANSIAFNQKGAITRGDASIIKNNSIFNNKAGVISSALTAPIITNRSSNKISGTAPNGTIVQLFYDNGFNKNAQGKEYIGEAYPVSGVWDYNGSISNYCSVTAIAIDTTKKQSSTFSLGTIYSLGPDITVCNGDSVILDAKAGFNNYIWSTGSTERSIKIFNPGKYIVTVDNGCVYKDTVEVFYRSKPLVNLGKDTTVCNGQLLSLNAGNEGASYLWNNNSLLQNLNITSTGSYSVKVSFDRCNNSDTIKVVVLNQTTTNLGADVYLCDKDSVTLFPNPNSINNKYLWSTGDSSNTLKVKKSGKYWVRVSNSCFPSSSDTVNVSLKPLIVNLGADTIICSGQTLRLKAPMPNAAFKWYNNSYFLYNDSIRTVTTSGKYYVSVHQGSCEVSDTIFVTQKTKPSISLGADTYVCNGDSLLLDAGANGTFYQWSTGNSSRYLTTKVEGVFVVKVSHNSDCYATDTIKVKAADCNKISGTLYNDENNDCIKNSNEFGMSDKFIVLKSSTTNELYYAYTDYVGKYSAKLPLDRYEVYPAQHKTFKTICPSVPFNVILDNKSVVSDKDFSITFNAIKDLSISLGESSRIRLGENLNSVIRYDNLGTVSSNGQIIFIKDPFLDLVSTEPAFSQQKGDTIIWDFANLLPDENRNIQIQLFLPVINGIIGRSVYNTAMIIPVLGDINPFNNTSNGESLVSYSYDPNDKISDKGAKGNVTVNDSVFHYTINFQNLGNDFAHKVVIKDTLSEYFDVLSFESGAGSHPHKVDVSEKGIITWTFNNIMLPDSTSDNDKSKGFIKYTIKVDPNLALGTVLSNNAGIYFDLAEPVITNTTEHTIVDQMKTQNINFPAITDKEYLDATVDLKAGASSGLPLKFAWEGPVVVVDGKLIINGTGQVRVRAYQEGDAEFYKSNFVDHVFKINKSDQKIIFDTITDKNVNDPSFEIIAKGGLSGNPLEFSVNSDAAELIGSSIVLKAPGTVVVKVSQIGNDNFNDAPEVIRIFHIKDILTEINESVGNEFSIYPNPVSERVDIKLKSGFDGDLKVFSSYGSLVLIDKIVSGKGILDVSSLEAGIYFIFIENKASRIKQPLVIIK